MTAIFAGAILALLTAWSAGRLLLQRLRIEFARLEEDLFGFLIGSACLSVAVFLVCSLHLARKGVFVCIGLLVIGTAVRLGALKTSTRRLDPLPSWWKLLFLLPFAIFTVLYFFNALAPEISPDGVAYHLGSVVRWWHDHGFIRYTGSMYANFPQGLEMLFLFAFSIGRHSSATLVHFAFLIVLPWLMVCYGRRFGHIRPFVLGAVLIYVSPVVGITGTTAYVDVAVACTLFGLFYILEIWRETRQPQLLIVAGLLAGFGYALKYTSGIGVLYAIGYVGWTLLRGQKPVFGPILTIAGSAAICILPWMLKNWIWVGNPLSPFFNSWFPNPYVHVWFENSYRTNMALYSEIKSHWELPYMVSVNGAYVGGLFGPWLLLTPLGLLACVEPRGRKLLVAAVIFGLPALGNSATRLLFPFAVFMAPAIGLALLNIQPIPLVLILSCLLSWPDVVAKYASPYAWRLHDIPVQAALRAVPEDAYLTKKIDGYAMARAIQELVPENAHVFMLWQAPQAYTTRRLWHWYESADGQLAFLALWTGHKPDMQPTLDLQFRFPQRSLNSIRVVQTARANELWSVSELEVSSQGQRVQRHADWRVSARPNPWDAARAMDNNSITAWSTAQAIEPNMFLRLDFNRRTIIDQVDLVCAPDQWYPKLRLEGLDASGHWSELSDKTERLKRPAPNGIRKAAIRELKSLGFDYVVARNDQDVGLDLFHNAPEWGVTCIRELNGGCLYRLD